MAQHELQCFRETAGLEEREIAMHSMMGGRPSRDFLQEHTTIFFGGSGAFSVLDDNLWIRDAIDVLVDVVDLKVPAYASCFGFQGLALAMGGSVINDESQTEMGSTLVHLTEAGQRDPLFGAMPHSFWVQEGHHDRVNVVPDAVEMIVYGDFCHEQAFKVKGAPFWASQFHPELTLAKTIDRFYHYAEYYLEPHEVASTLEMLRGGLETPEVQALLWRLVRGDLRGEAAE